MLNIGMTAASLQPVMSPEAFLAFERVAETKHEYWHGEVFAMAGASRPHNLLVANIVRLLGTALLDRPCEVYPSDMRVAPASGKVFTYPDVTVVCDGPRFTDDTQDTLVNPSVVVEVLSSSTEAYDRGKKFEHYLGLTSLRHYLLVAQDRALAELYTRQGDGTWTRSDHRAGDAIRLVAPEVTLEVDDVYRRVLEAGSSPSA